MTNRKRFARQLVMTGLLVWLGLTLSGLAQEVWAEEKITKQDAAHTINVWWPHEKDATGLSQEGKPTVLIKLDFLKQQKPLEAWPGTTYKAYIQVDGGSRKEARSVSNDDKQNSHKEFLLDFSALKEGVHTLAFVIVHEGKTYKTSWSHTFKK